MKNPDGISHVNLRERRYRVDSGKTLHHGKLSNLELDAEEYVLALINETNPLRYLASLLFSWISNALTLIFRHQFRSHPSLESSSASTDRMSWATICSIFFLKTLILFATTFEKLGNGLEYCLNIVYANDGLKNTLQRCLFNPDALRKPHQEDDNYYSFIGLVDPRQDLLLQRSGCTELPNMNTDDGIKSKADLCIMASKLSYENENVIKRVVNQQWKMNFVRYYDCWNEYLESNTTQAFIFTDKERDANFVVLAFRGTQPFNMYDWCTDFDFSYYVLPQMGKVHVGFLEALGLGSRLRKETLHKVKINTAMKASGQTPSSTPTSGLPQRILDDDHKVLAYDAICAKIRDLLRANLGAQLYITGHSLGGALATLFTGLLLFEHDHILDRLSGTFTFGQPRVGDSKFASYMETHLCKPSKRKYFRVVYQSDIVTRVPFDDRLLQFKHIAPCQYYHSVFEAKILGEEPHKNVYLLVFLPASHLYAIRHLIRTLRRRFIRSRNNEQCEETGLCLLMQFGALLTPGICAHLPTNYVDAIRNAPSKFLCQVERLEEGRSTWILGSMPQLLTRLGVCRRTQPVER